MSQRCRHTVFSLHLHGRMPYRRETPNACTLTIRAQIEDLRTVDFHRHDRSLQMAVFAPSCSVAAVCISYHPTAMLVDRSFVGIQLLAQYSDAMQTLFLDFDGVLHPEFCHESKHFCCLPFFEEAVRQAPEVEIVIASTWRHQHRLEDLARRFSADVSHRVIGVTPYFPALDDVPDTLVSFEREAECNAWLRANGRVASPWLAVDDRSWLYRPFNRSVFLVNGKTGLTAQASRELVQRLQTL